MPGSFCPIATEQRNALAFGPMAYMQNFASEHTSLLTAGFTLERDPDIVYGKPSQGESSCRATAVVTVTCGDVARQCVSAVMAHTGCRQLR